MIKIDKGVPIPKKKNGRKPLYDFGSMEIGDSFWVEGGHKRQVSVLNCAARYKPHKFKTSTVVRRVDKKDVTGIRCWRIS